MAALCPGITPPRLGATAKGWRHPRCSPTYDMWVRRAGDAPLALDGDARARYVWPHEELHDVVGSHPHCVYLHDDVSLNHVSHRRGGLRQVRQKRQARPGGGRSAVGVREVTSSVALTRFISKRAAACSNKHTIAAARFATRDHAQPQRPLHRAGMCVCVCGWVWVCLCGRGGAGLHRLQAVTKVCRRSNEKVVDGGGRHDQAHLHHHPS